MPDDRVCDGCAVLEIEPRSTKYGYYLACCTDAGKPQWLGARHVVSAAQIGPPFHIIRPVWCRGKQEKK